MLLSKAIHLTDTVTESVTAHLPGPVAMPVHLAVSALTWAPRRVVGGVEHLVGQRGPAERTGPTAVPNPARTAATRPTDQGESPEATEPHEPEVVLTLDRPAAQVEPPIDVVGDALRAEQAAPTPQASDLDDEGHVEVEEEVVYSTSSDQG